MYKPVDAILEIGSFSFVLLTNSESSSIKLNLLSLELIAPNNPSTFVFFIVSSFDFKRVDRKYVSIF